MKKIFLIVLLIVVVGSGCTIDNSTNQSQNDMASLESSPNDAGEDEAVGFATATSPTFPDLRGNTFDIYLLGAASEPFFEITKSISNGLEDGIAYINAEGGVYGANINYHFIGVSDYIVELEEAYKDIVRLEPYLILLAAPVSQDFYEIVNESKVPVLFFGFGTPRLKEPESGEDYLFWLTPYPDEQMVFALQQIWLHWDDVRPPGNFNEMKVGYLSWETERYKDLALSSEAKVFIQRHSYSLESAVYLPVSPNASATNFLLEAVYKGITVIFTDTVTSGPPVLVNDLTSLGLSDFFVVSGTEWMMGSYVQDYMRYDGEPARIYVPLSTAWWSEESNPAILKARQIRSASGREVSDFGYLLSLGVVDMIVNLLTTGIEETEGLDLSAESMMGYLSAYNYDVMGGLFLADYRNGNRSIQQMRLWQYESDENFMSAVSEISDVPNLIFVEE